MSKTNRKEKRIRRNFWNGMGATPGQLNAAKVWNYVHRTLGYPSIAATDRAFRSGIFGKFMNPPEHLKKCAVCANAGFTRPNIKRVKHGKKRFDKGVAWSADLCGPFKEDRKGIKWVLGFTEVSTGFTKV